MKNITDLTTAETILFPVDTIPFNFLLIFTNLQKLTKTLKFKSIETPEDENKNILSLTMTTGEFHHNDTIYPVEKLMIERNRILVAIKADSDVTDNFCQTIIKFLSEIDPYKRIHDTNKKIRTYITNCIVTLDFDHMQLFSPKFRTFIHKNVTKACSSAISDVARVHIEPRNLSFNIVYSHLKKSLVDPDFQISSKLLTIEPRVGTNPRERRFFTSSPTNSKTHIKLLQDLEKALSRREKLRTSGK